MQSVRIVACAGCFSSGIRRTPERGSDAAFETKSTDVATSRVAKPAKNDSPPSEYASAARVAKPRRRRSRLSQQQLFGVRDRGCQREPRHTTNAEKDSKNSREDNVDVKALCESFDKLMQHKKGRKMFGEYLEIEHSRSNLEFWIACQNIKLAHDEVVLRDLSKWIYTTYVSSNSTTEVNLDSAVRAQLKEKLSNPDKHMYDAAASQVYQMMSQDSFHRFAQFVSQQEAPQDVRPNSFA